jgi:hypothetical protein
MRSSAADRGDRVKLRAKTARYWPGADAQAGAVSDMSRKVGTEWAVSPISPRKC